MNQTKFCCFWALLLVLAAHLEAQEYNSVPLNHGAYDVIAMGIVRGVISQPPSAKPWSLHEVRARLWEMIDDPEQVLSAEEEETVVRALESLDRNNGFVLKDGRYWVKGGSFTFETGFGWESIFSVASSKEGGTISSVNLMKVYAGGDIADFSSWNVTALGEFLYIERELLSRPAYDIPSAFPHTFSKQWDGGVLSLRNSGTYAGWPDDPALAYGLEAEVNGVFFDRHLQLRLGRTRRDWGHGYNGSSLFINSHARPFTALEGTWLPLPWLNISFLSGALEHFREDNCWTNDGQLSDMLLAAHVEFNPFMLLHFDIGGALVPINQPDAAFFANLELRLPGLFTLWGGFFVDRLNATSENFSSMSGNSYAYQAGIRTVLHWLPFAAFTLSYTKVEPYCYAAFQNGGESLGYYSPPNSDELLVRLESMLFPDIKAHIQFQMMRRGADYGYGAVGGSSRYDTLDDGYCAKYFLKDGVYRWDNVIKIGASVNLKTVNVPLLIYMETGFVLTSFTINGDAEIGEEAEYEPLSDSVYRPGNHYIFSIGFRLFP